MKRPRVLIVDDSAFVRTVLARLLRATNQIDVVSTAVDGEDALERIGTLDPDIVTLDLTMPRLDGLGVLRALHGRPRPRVIVVSVSSIDTELGAEALALGAIDLIAKPTALANDRLDEIGTKLVARILAVSALLPTPQPVVTKARRTPAALVMIGTSTGGPQALTKVLAGLPAGLDAPVAIALHIPREYTLALAQRLDKLCALHVIEASDGLELVPGIVALAPGGRHLHVDRVGSVLRCRVSLLPAAPFRPSVDELFASGVAATGAASLGVVLTGMGDDGLIGARLIARAGGSLLAEAASTCVVYGMPRCVLEADLGARSVELDRIAEEIVKHVKA